MKNWEGDQVEKWRERRKDNTKAGGVRGKR